MNIEFPVLDNGLIAQIPLNLRISKAIIHNKLRDGGLLMNSTSGLTKYSWDLTYNNLSPSEMSKFVTFWEETNRGARPIRFYDPLGNLLRRSEELLSLSWQRIGQIVVTEVEPFEGHRQYLLTNAGDFTSELYQTVQVESTVALVFSLKARWAGASSLALASEAGNSIASADFYLEGHRACELSIKSGFQSSVRKISIRVPGHTQILVSQPQLEVGFKRGDYLRSLEGGVFEAAWIDPDSFRLWCTAPACYSISIKVDSFR